MNTVAVHGVGSTCADQKNPVTPPRTPPQSVSQSLELTNLLLSRSVRPSIVREMVATCQPDRIRQIVRAADAVAKSGGWIVAAWRGKWDVEEQAALPSRWKQQSPPVLSPEERRRQAAEEMRRAREARNRPGALLC